MRPFEYHRATDATEAARLGAAEGAAFLAGGQTLVRDAKRGIRSHPVLVDLVGVLDRSIWSEGDTILIGAGATHSLVASSPLVRGRIPMLSGMVGHIADSQVRNRGTIGGAMAANEPAGDYPAAALALGATVVTTNRRIPADVFLNAAGKTLLDRGEIIVAVSFPVPVRAGYAKILHPAARYALVGSCTTLGRDGTVRVAVTGAAVAGAFRWEAAERALASELRPGTLADVALPDVPLREDTFADAVYRAHLAVVMAARAVDASHGDGPVRVYSHGAPIPGGLRRRS